MLKYFTTLIAGFVIATPALAFNFDGLYSGMTIPQLQEFAARNGLMVKSMDAMNLFLEDPKTNSWYANLVVCDGTLVQASKKIDPDAEYMPLLDDLLSRLGQPKVAMQRLPVWQQPGVFVYESQLTWYKSGDRTRLSMTPESRDGKGQLRFTRGATIAYAVRSSCAKEF